MAVKKTSKKKDQAPGKGDGASLPAMQVETVEVSSLVPYEDNPRINDHAVERMAQAIQQFGFRVPILVRGDNEVVDGHLRRKALLALGVVQVPVIRVDDLSDTQIRALRLQVNKSAEWAEWDEQKLAEEIAWLVGNDFDVGAAGFDGPEVQQLLASIDDPDGALAEITAGEVDTGPGGTVGKDEAPLPDATLVALTFNIAPSERQAVLAHLNKVKDAEGLGTLSHALVHVCSAPV